MKNYTLAPSLLSANFLNLKEDLDLLEKLNVKWVHYDVMDGHFVDNISFGPYILSQINSKYDFFLDVHLMIKDPLKYLDAFTNSGASLITFHYEAVKKEEIPSLIKLIKERGVKAGLSIKPKTDVSKIKEYLKDLDLVLVMSVEPGFGGQKFDSSALEKISTLSKLKEENNYSYLIEVDGGINEETASMCKERGIDVLVMGSYYFKYQDKEALVRKIKNN